tara:strand:- start:103 stop:543 length:441 start_codon:yes stop_codon:yes gene_type:complete
MKQKQKPLSFSLCEANHNYIAEQVAERKIANHRYNRSMYMDDLITHLRTRNKSVATTANIATVEKNPVKRFVPPTVEQVFQYCNERCNNVDAQNFVDHYTANGWMRGKVKVKDWKACVRTWEKSTVNKQQGKTSGNLSACEDFING